MGNRVEGRCAGGVGCTGDGGGSGEEWGGGGDSDGNGGLAGPDWISYDFAKIDTPARKDRAALPSLSQPV